MDETDSWLGGLDWTSVGDMPGSLSHGMEDFLLPAEDVIAEGRGVVLVNIDVAGTLLVSNFRLIFVSEGQRNVVPLGTIPLATIEKFHKQPMRATSVSRARDKTASRRLLQVIGKDMRIVTYGFRARTRQRRAVFEGLVRLMKPTRLWDLYAFTSGSSMDKSSDPRVRLHTEYLRLLGLQSCSDDDVANLKGKSMSSRQYWRLTDVNSSYTLCPTYPSLFITASSVSDEELQQAAAFRSRRRLPVISWLHPENDAVLARSSQPLIGLMMNNRSNADEKLVASLCAPTTDRQEHRKLYIADARPRKNAIANGAMGGGSESSANYFQSEVVFLGIDNIHAMRDSLARLRDYLDMHGAASSDGSSSLLRSGGLAWGGGNLSSMSAAVSALGDSGWLMHVHSVLAGATWIAARVALEGASVLVHCSDGWDRTTQVVSLAELMLDPYYRTFKGFQALVEKEWLSFGHPFADRHGLPIYTGGSIATVDSFRQSTGNAGPSSPARIIPGSSFSSSMASHSSGLVSNNYSPIFLQWVDCVSQLLHLYPRAFEFSLAFLVELVDCVLSCRFGNFLCNSERERLQVGVADLCGCMWIYLETQRSPKRKGHEHYNIFYSYDQHQGPLLPPAAALAPILWPHFFLRWACPSEMNTAGCLPSSWVRGGEPENQCRVLAQSLSGLKKAKEKVELKVKQLTAKLEALNERLLMENQAVSSAVVTSTRVCKENAAIKHAIHAIGCKVHFSDLNGTTFGLSSSDEDERLDQNIIAGDGHSSEGMSNNSQSKDQASNLSVCLSLTDEADMAANLFRKTCGDTTCRLRNEEGCKWPQGSCALMGSAFVGLRANFDALKELSILDCYFNPGNETTDSLCLPHSQGHEHGIT
eukprot:c29027_g2_i1 orf=103-2715(-)